MKKNTILRIFSFIMLASLIYVSPLLKHATVAFADDTSIFTKDLRASDTDPQVKILQQYLNSHGFLVSSSGVGSPGQETNFFGAKTKTALNLFQKINGLTLGYFGPLTRGFLNGKWNGGGGTRVPCSNGALFNFETGQPCSTDTSVDNTPPDEPACAINSLLLSPSIVQAGGSSTLTWSTSDCASVSISGIGTGLAASGSVTGVPPATTTYVLTTPNGLIASATITVTTAIPTPTCSIDSFTAAPSGIQNGGSSTLTWSTSNCTNVTISGIGSVAAVGTSVVSPSVTTVYTLTTAPNNLTANAAVTVSAPTPVCSISSFAASPSSIVTGVSATLTWSTSNCASVSISGIGSGLSASGSRTVTPSTTAVYTLTTPNNLTAVATVTVIAPTCAINSFAATPATVQSPNASALSWSTSNCSSVTISGVGSGLAASGTQLVAPTSTTTFTLTTPNALTATAKVTVTAPVPVCSINSFTASPASITTGGSSILTWNTSNCASVSISGIGSGLAASSTRTVTPSATTTYVLTTPNSLTATATVTVSAPAPVCTINSFAVSPSTVQNGASATLTWNTSNCASVAISGIGTGLASSGSVTGVPTATTSFTLTTPNNLTATVTITVIAAVPTCAINSFSASPSSIATGASATLTWSTSNCASVTISSIGTGLTASSTRTVTPSATTTYTLTTPNNLTASATVTVSSTTSGGGSGAANSTTPMGYAMVNGTTTGGAGGTVTTVSTFAQLKAAVSGNAPKIIYVTGTIAGAGHDPVYVGSNTSIIGKPGATLTAMNLFLQTVNNVIIQNLTLSNYVTDAGIQMKYNTTHVWIDHCTFSTDRNNGWDYWGKDITITRQVDYVTVSWSVFHDTNLSFLIGVPANVDGSDEGYLHVTLHHNFWYNVSEREPTAYFGSIHMFDNYHLNNGGYSIGSRGNGTIRTDNEYFQGDNKPITTNLDGDPPGSISGANTNIYVNSGSNDITTPTSTWVPPYSYSQYLDPASSVPSLIQQNAGPKLNT